MTVIAENQLEEIFEAYGNFGALVVGAVRYGCGHINDTFCVYTQLESGDGKRYILQRMSAVAFKHPDQLMENIVGVTRWLSDIIQKNGGDCQRETMTVIPTLAGYDFHTDSTGRAWRTYSFVEDTLCLQKVESPTFFYASAKAFGKFQNLLRDYPVETLHETIEQFHDTENRLAILKKVIEEDKLGNVASAQKEIEFALARQEDCSVCMQALRDGILPLRVTHNDTKLNNVLLDKTTKEGICIIDLDTVMAGLSVNDFGDSIRFGANNSAEDEQDLTKVNFDISLYDLYAKGFLEEAGEILTPAELDYMPWGAKLMTLECGIRFLSDYLVGDVYFRTNREGHNLDRCRTQFKLVADMESQWDAMISSIDQYRR